MTVENGGASIRLNRISLSMILAIIVQTIGLVTWLVTMRLELNQVKDHHIEIDRRLDAMDQAGPRALDLIRQRQVDVIATNASQDQRLRDVEMKINEAQRQIIESKFWIDQMSGFIKNYSHPPMPTR